MPRFEIPRKWQEFVIGSIDCDPEQIAVEKIAGDGSVRDFYRIETDVEKFILMANPNPPSFRGVDENDSFGYVAGVLKVSGVRVPEVFDYDSDEGLFLLEDFGDRYLQDHILEIGKEPAETLRSYRELIDILIQIQIKATPLFNPERVFNPEYDSRFMYEKEALYFAEFFVRGYCSLDDSEILPELKELSSFAASKFTDKVFLYRDFQSRNVMYLDGENGFSRWGLLDFQGARLGPRTYDLASLIYDPYVELNPDIRSELLQYYLDNIPGSVDKNKVAEEFPPVAAHRLMQAMGAYGKLGGRDGKEDFLKYIGPALRGLNELLEKHEELGRFSQLARFIKKI